MTDSDSIDSDPCRTKFHPRLYFSGSAWPGISVTLMGRAFFLYLSPSLARVRASCVPNNRQLRSIDGYTGSLYALGEEENCSLHRTAGDSESQPVARSVREVRSSVCISIRLLLP
eukprot:GFKZ01014187.1.p2 GENE.GFKZ01014187.1~~GFKZ01014187.1.p2  ORF type:complete len:115 (-),score=0.62 GFKZ01014187.1:910-1254(-)